MNNKSDTELWDLIQLSDQYKHFKYTVKKRGQYKCLHCETPGDRKNRIHVHHLKMKSKDKWFHLVFSVNNAILLCQKCHIAEHKRMNLEEPDIKSMKTVSTTRLKNLVAKCTFNIKNRRKSRYRNRNRYSKR